MDIDENVKQQSQNIKEGLTKTNLKTEKRV